MEKDKIEVVEPDSSADTVWNPLELMALRSDRDTSEFNFLSKMKTREQIIYRLRLEGLPPLE